MDGYFACGGGVFGRDRVVRGVDELDGCLRRVRRIKKLHGLAGWYLIGLLSDRGRTRACIWVAFSLASGREYFLVGGGRFFHFLCEIL